MELRRVVQPQVGYLIDHRKVYEPRIAHVEVACKLLVIYGLACYSLGAGPPVHISTLQCRISMNS